MSDIGVMYCQELIPLIMNGTKTETRRLKGLEKINENPDNWRFVYEELGVFYFEPVDKHCIAIMVKCPYKVGDWMYCKETWAKVYDEWTPVYDDSPFVIEYKANTGNKYPGYWPEEYKDDEACGRWRPSIHMPKKYARTWKQLTGMRCERLQDITEEGAKDEGCDRGGWTEDGNWRTARLNFEWLWDSLHPKHPWSGNWWTFVLDWKEKGG